MTARHAADAALDDRPHCYAYIDEDDEERFTAGSLRITPDQAQAVYASLSL